MITVTQIIKDGIRSRINTFSDQLANGLVQNWEQYQKLVGKIEVLRDIEQDVVDLEDKIQGT